MNARNVPVCVKTFSVGRSIDRKQNRATAKINEQKQEVRNGKCGNSTKLYLDKKFHKNFDSITLGCQIGKFEDMIARAEKELAEGKEENNAKNQRE